MYLGNCSSLHWLNVLSPCTLLPALCLSYFAANSPSDRLFCVGSVSSYDIIRFLPVFVSLILFPKLSCKKIWSSRATSSVSASKVSLRCSGVKFKRDCTLRASTSPERRLYATCASLFLFLSLSLSNLSILLTK